MAKNVKAESKVSDSKSVILTSVICAVVLIAVIVWAILTKSANSLGNKVAMTVGDIEVSGVELKFEYKDAILEFQNEYGENVSLFGIDFNSDLDEQTFSEDMSWKDYFMDTAINTLTERYLVVNAANDAGYELPQEDIDTVDSELKALKAQLSSFGIDYSSYLNSVYGKELSVKLFRDFSVANTLAYNYLQQVRESFNIDDAQINEYYSSNKDSVDTVDFRFHHFAYTVPAEATEGDESYKADAKAKADIVLSAVTDEHSFDMVVKAQLTDTEAVELNTLSENVLKANLLPDLATWLFDSARVAGDKTVIEGNNGYFVLYFCERELADYETVNVRHILFATPAVEHNHEEGEEHNDAEIAEEQAKADAEVYAKAEAVLNEWLAGDKTEESFAALAEKNSEDGATGGLYTQVTKGYMVEEFDSWIFDESRVAGDYEIIKTDYGYHIMYFVGKDEIAWKLSAKTAIENEKYSEYMEELKSKYEVATFEEVIDLVD